MCTGKQQRDFVIVFYCVLDDKQKEMVVVPDGMAGMRES